MPKQDTPYDASRPTRPEGKSRDEIIRYDSLKSPEEIINFSEAARRSFVRPRLESREAEASLMYVTSTGRYREGADFYSFHYGFFNYALTVVLGGRGQAKLRGKTIQMKRGDTLFFSNYEPVITETADEEWAFCVFNISGDPCRLYDHLWNGDGVELIHIENPELFEDYRRRINRAISQPGVQSDLEVNRLLTNALTELLAVRNGAPETAERQPAFVTEAAAYIAAHYGEPLAIADVAERFFLSTDYFTRQFKKYTGRTPKDYLTLCRVDEAALLLRGTDLPMVDIACRAGFASQSRFAEVFRRVYGLSPTDYRKHGAENG